MLVSFEDPKASVQLREGEEVSPSSWSGGVRPAAGGSATDFDSKAVSMVLIYRSILVTNVFIVLVYLAIYYIL